MASGPAQILAVICMAAMIISSSSAPDDPNKIFQDAMNNANFALGSHGLPPLPNIQVTDWKGVSDSHTFPGGSVSGSSYTGKIVSGGAVPSPQIGILVFVLSSVLFLVSQQW